MVERAKAELGRIDILVNNAGRAWVAACRDQWPWRIGGACSR